jgi:hypothetical protein
VYGAEKMHDVFGTGQQGQVSLDDDAVETVASKNQEACKKILAGFIGRLLRRFGWIPKSSVQAAGGIKPAGGSHCVLCVLATWREKKRGYGDRERRCQGDCRRGFPGSYDAWARFAGIGLSNGFGV